MRTTTWLLDLRSLVLAVAAGLLLPAGVSSASEIASCRLSIAKAIARHQSAYQTSIDLCLEGEYEDCASDSPFLDRANTALLNAVTGERSKCLRALESGASMLDLAPATCAGRLWYDKRNWRYPWSSSEVACNSAISDLEGLHGCLLCQSRGLGDRVPYDLDFPIFATASVNDRRCIRSAITAATRAYRAGLQAATRCAKQSGEPPWNCPLDPSPDGKFGRNLVKLDLGVGRCIGDSGVPGEIGQAVKEMCNSVVTSSAELSGCLRRATTCRTCLAINLSLQRSDDCAAMSGDPDCIFNPVKPIVGSFVVTNRDDDSISFFTMDGQPLLGSLETSTFATGPAPIGAVISEKTNTVAVLNSGDDSVTLLGAGTGAPRNGSLQASTVVVGSDPLAMGVNPGLDVLYVVNSADGTVTFLDASDGSYAFGTLASSTFPVGNEPSGVVTNAAGEILYVINTGDGTVAFLDAATGAPWFGTLPMSTFAVGTAPRAIAVLPPLNYGSFRGEALAVADAADGMVRTFDAATGLPVARLGGSTEIFLGPGLGNTMVADESRALFAVSDTLPGVLTWSAEVGVQAIETDGIPTGVALGALESQVGVVDPEAGISRRPLLVSFADSDEAVLTRTSGITNAGRSACELSSVDSFGYDSWIYDAPNNQYIGLAIASGYPTTIGFFDAATLSLVREIAAPPETYEVGYLATSDTLLTRSDSRGITFLDPATGQGRFGSIETSTRQCGCVRSYSMAVSESANRIYINCLEHVAYLDATTGVCLGGSPATTGAPSNISTLTVDDASGVVLASSGQGIFRLDPFFPQYDGGTFQDSVLSGSAAKSWYGLLRTDGNGNVYGGGYFYINSSTRIDAFEIATGTQVGQTTIPSAIWALDVDAEFGNARGAFGYLGVTGIGYFRLPDLTPLNGDLDSSFLKSPYSVGRWTSTLLTGLARGTTDAVVMGRSRAARLRRDTAAFVVDQTSIDGITVSTGRFPSAVATMPPHTLY
ncbi:MAG: YncE family protein [Candidatus Binatia bacterium]